MCFSFETEDESRHAEMDAYGKTNGLTVVYAGWHIKPEYRIFKTGSLLRRNDEYPSGLIFIDIKGKPQKYQAHD